MRLQDDLILDEKVERLHRDIEMWACKNELWSDCGFFDYTDRVQPIEWDKTGYVTVLAADGPIATTVISSYEVDDEQEPSLREQFEFILEKHGFWYENHDHTQMWIYAIDPSFEQQFREYMRWRWICSLIKPEFDLLDQELYAHFGENPDRLSELHWRDFEKIVAALLESQGYEVELGPGSNDGGVDLKLLQRDPIGDILTLVQAKRHSRHRKIKLDAVQALHGAFMAEGAQRSMFITTSTYLPSARKFAARSNVQMTLHTSSDVQRWCVEACDGIVEDKRALIGLKDISRAIEDAKRDYRRIFVKTGGYEMVINTFSVVLKETNHAALLLDLKKRIVDHDGYQQQGHEVPEIRSVPKLSGIGPREVRRVRKVQGGAGKFWDGQGYFSPWDGDPAYFDYRD